MTRNDVLYTAFGKCWPKFFYNLEAGMPSAWGRAARAPRKEIQQRLALFGFGIRLEVAGEHCNGVLYHRDSGLPVSNQQGQDYARSCVGTFWYDRIVKVVA